MNENTPPEGGTPEPAPEPEAPTQTFEPAPPADATPNWAREKLSRNFVVGGAAVAGAVVALVGASLVGDDDHGKGDRMGFRGGPPQMQGGGQFQGPPGQGGQQRGPQGDGQFQGPGQGQGQGQGGQSDQSDSQ